MEKDLPLVPADGTEAFEDALAKLEAIVTTLDEGDVAIDTAVRLYEEGMRLARLCHARLDAAELRVNQVTPQSDGTFGLRPFVAG